MTRSSYRFAALIGAVVLSASSLAAASSESVLYAFPKYARPFAQLQEDSLGNLYGTAATQDEFGNVYRLKEVRQTWQAKIIHRFAGDDGENPRAGLTPDRTAGIFYGTTSGGGAFGNGTVFSLTQSGGKWTETVLHDFSATDGLVLDPLLTRDKATGALYGVAYAGGANGCGNAYRLDPATRQFDILYWFRDGDDACLPNTQLREGPQPGTLFGGTLSGGAGNYGTLFLLTERGGAWKESVVYTFTGQADGYLPSDLTVAAEDGSIYGTALGGGAYQKGVVFQLIGSRNAWVYTVIHTFTGGSDGAYPVGLHLDRPTGVLYGTTVGGGGAHRGVVFRLTNTAGQWTETILHSFTGGADGHEPQSRPILDPRTGILYGTTLHGGTNNGGIVYSVTP